SLLPPSCNSNYFGYTPNAFRLSIHGYGALEADHSQWVLPLSGSLNIDISGQRAQLARYSPVSNEWREQGGW
nr:hypothetical protein [Dickeya chrysanthemi]